MLRNLFTLKFLAIATFLLVAAILPLSADSICDNTAGNLVVNCGFETGNFSGWVLNAGATGVCDVTQGPCAGGFVANSGNDFAFLGPVGGDGTLSQTLTTNPGDTYDFSFYWASNGSTPSDLSAFWDGGNALFSVTNPPGSPYTLESFDVTATGSDTIELAFRDDPNYLALDDVSVVDTQQATTPEPATLTLLMLGGGFLLKRRKNFVK